MVVLFSLYSLGVLILLDFNRDRTLVLLYSLLYFIFMVVVAFTFYNKGYYDIYNVFFDDDPNTNIKSMAYSVLGEKTRNAYSHIFLELISIPIQIIHKTVKWVRAEHLALIVSPLMMTFSFVIMYKTLRFFSNKDTSLLLAISFSLIYCNFIFGVMPSTYTQGLFSLTLINYYFVRSICYNNDSVKFWVFLGVLLSSITITNIVIFAIYYFVYKFNFKQRIFLKSAWSTFLVSTISLFMTISIYIIYSYFFKNNIYGVEGRPGWIINYLSFDYLDIIKKLKNLWNSLYFAFTPSHVEFRDLGRDDIVGLSYIKESAYNYAWITVLFILSSIISVIRSRGVLEVNLLIVSVLVVIYNFAFHSIFSYEQYLYVLHWILSVFMLALPLVLKFNNKIIIALLFLQLFVIFDFLVNVESLVSLA